MKTGITSIILALVQGYYCCDEHHDQKQAGEDRVYWAYSSTLMVHH